jgi:hypothetical protein
MSHILLIALLAGQIPPPPVPYSPEKQSPSADQSPPANDPKAQREWLLAYLTEQAQGKLDAKKYRDIEKTVNNVQDSYLGKLIRYYQDRKAHANLGRSGAYGDSLNRELQWKTAFSRHEQAQGDMQYSPRLAVQQPPWAMQNFNAAPIQDVYTIQPWRYPIYWPYYSMPLLHYRHHR